MSRWNNERRDCWWHPSIRRLQRKFRSLDNLAPMPNQLLSAKSPRGHESRFRERFSAAYRTFTRLDAEEFRTQPLLATICRTASAFPLNIYMSDRLPSALSKVEAIENISQRTSFR